MFKCIIRHVLVRSPIILNTTFHRVKELQKKRLYLITLNPNFILYEILCNLVDLKQAMIIIHMNGCPVFIRVPRVYILIMELDCLLLSRDHNTGFIQISITEVQVTVYSQFTKFIDINYCY